MNLFSLQTFLDLLQLESQTNFSIQYVLSHYSRAYVCMSTSFAFLDDPVQYKCFPSRQGSKGAVRDKPGSDSQKVLLKTCLSFDLSYPQFVSDQNYSFTFSLLRQQEFFFNISNSLILMCLVCFSCICTHRVRFSCFIKF